MTKTSWQSKLEQAFALQQENKIPDAISFFQEVLDELPEQPDALHGMGVAYAQRGDFAKAIDYLKRATTFAPLVAEFHNNLANAYKATGRINEALQHYQEALRLKSPYPEAHNNLGGLLYRLGKYEKAAEHFQKSLRMDPDAVDTHFNLALTYTQLQRLIDAITHFEEVLKRRPDHLNALHNLGVVLCSVKRFSEANSILKKVYERDPNNIDILFYLGLSETNTAHSDEALKYYEKILKLDPHHVATHHNIAMLFLNKGENDKALFHFEEAYRYNPADVTAKHLISSLKRETTEESPPLEYVRALFDQYAYHYDKHMTVGLQYQTPHLLRSALAPFVTHITHPIKGLDLGCGTGLCAPYFTDIVSHFTGVDLSENMLIVAKQQGGYHQLVHSDILSYLQYKFKEFDLIVSSDVLVYFASLEKLFVLCRQALTQNGFFCFSIEQLSEEEIQKNPEFSEYQLRETGRYAHSPAYTEALAKKLNFTVLAKNTEVIRYQSNDPIMGSIYVLKKENDH